MINSMISNSLTAKDAPTIADGVNNANDKLDVLLERVIPQDLLSNDSRAKSPEDELANAFKFMAKKHRIVDFLNVAPESNTYFEIFNGNNLSNFKQEVINGIVMRFDELQNTKRYEKAKQFLTRLDEYVDFIYERAVVDISNQHLVLKDEKEEQKSSSPLAQLRAAVSKKNTGREDVYGVLPQGPSIFDGKGIRKVRELDDIYYEITGCHFLLGTKLGGWVDRDIPDEVEEKLINELGCYKSEKLTIPEQMLDVFRFAIDKCQIIRFLKCDPTHRLEFPVLRIDYFINTMENLFDDYRHNQKEPIFGAISQFNGMLQAYSFFLGCKLWTLNDSVSDVYVPYPNSGRRMSSQEEQSFAEQVLVYRQKINELYGKVCNGETMFV